MLNISSAPIIPTTVEFDFNWKVMSLFLLLLDTIFLLINPLIVDFHLKFLVCVEKTRDMWFTLPASLFQLHFN